MKRFAVVARLIRPNWRYVAQSFFVLVPMMGLSLPGPFITKLLIDDVYSQKDETLMALVLVAVATISLGAGLTGSVFGHFGACVYIAMGYDMKSRCYNHILGLDFAFLHLRKAGEILSRFRDMDASVGQLIGMANTALTCPHLCIHAQIWAQQSGWFRWVTEPDGWIDTMCPVNLLGS